MNPDNVRLLLLITLLTFVTPLAAQRAFKRTLVLMGSVFEITVVAEDSLMANGFIDSAVSEIERIERLISSWDENSQTTEINRNAGVKPVKVDLELFQLIKRANAISSITDGAFDISYASMDKVWNFDSVITKMPSKESIRQSIIKVGYQNIITNDTDLTVYLKTKGMKIGFGAIGKGYAADAAKKLLIEKGCSAGIINASGDMNTWGKQPNGEKWQVAITNPMDKSKFFGLLPIYNSAVVTSGDYEKYFVLDGKRYSHIIDTRTGYPASGLVSVTVFAQRAELADALATALFVMGKEIGLDRVNQLPNVECIIIDDQGSLHASKNIKINANE